MNDELRRGLLIGMMFLGMLLGVGSARQTSAHAELVNSTPPTGTALAIAPARIDLRFSERVDAGLSSIELLDASGTNMTLAPVAVDAHDSHLLVAEVQDPAALGAGVYTILWEAYSAEDGHASSGSFTFSVGTGQVPEQSTASESRLSAWSIVGKWLELLGLVIVTGLALFSLSDAQSARSHLSALSRVAVALACIGLIGGLISLRARAVTISGGSFFSGLRLETISALLDESYGRAWLVRIAAVVAITLGGLRLARGGSRRWFTFMIVAGLTGLLSIAISGHAVTVSRAGLGVLVDLAHMTAAAVWLGGLLGLILVVDAAEPDLGRLRRQGNRFAVAVAIIVTAGIASVYWHIGGRRSLQQTDYGRTLLIKLAIVGGMLGIALYNRRVLQAEPNRGRWIVLATGAELALAVVVLLFSADLSQTPPASVPLEVQVAARPIDLNSDVSTGSTTVSLTGVLTGDPTDEIQIEVTPATDLQRVIVRSNLTTDTGAQVGDRFDATAVEGEVGRYVFPAGRLGISGPWQLEITVRRAGVEDQTVDVPIDTRGLAVRGTRTVDDQWSGVRLTSHTALALLLAAGMLVIGLGGLRRITGLEPLASGFLLAASLLIAGGFLVSAARGLAPVTPDHAVANPVADSARVITYAGALYQPNCALCHGVDGRGAETANAAHLHGSSADLTGHQTEMQSDGDLRYWIANGVPGTRMPAFDQALTEDEQWQLVLLIRELQDQARATEAAE